MRKLRSDGITCNHGLLNGLCRGIGFASLARIPATALRAKGDRQVGERLLPLKVVVAGLGDGSVHGINDSFGLAIKRLPRLLTVLGHPGHIAEATAEDSKGAGDALRDRGHGNSLRRGHSKEDAHDCTRSNGTRPRTNPGRSPYRESPVGQSMSGEVSPWRMQTCALK